MAKRLRFLRNWNHHAKRMVSVHYKAGTVVLVPEGAAKQAIAAGAAVIVGEPNGG